MIMRKRLSPLRFNDLFGGVPAEWQRQSAFIDHFRQAALTAMSIIVTQLPNIQASFGRAAPSPPFRAHSRRPRRHRRCRSWGLRRGSRSRIPSWFLGLLCICCTSSMTDNSGNLQKQQVYISSSDNFTQYYEYDSLNRLQSVREADSWKQTYVYDRFGNRTSNTSQSATYGGVNNLSFDGEPGTNRLLAPGDLAQTDLTLRRMQYDAAGNLKKDTYTGTGDRIYDAENRMTQAWGNGQWQYYTYDGDGRRVARNVNGAVTWQIYGIGGELVAEYAQNVAASAPQKEYGYRNGQLLITTETATGSAPPPTALAANPPITGANVTFNWTAASGAANYRVERRAAEGTFSSIGTTPSTTITDTGASNGSAYLYKVCAADGSGNCTSAYSNVVLGARFNFPTDSTLTTIADDSSGVTVTPMKAAHIVERSEERRVG